MRKFFLPMLLSAGFLGANLNANTDFYVDNYMFQLDQAGVMNGLSADEVEIVNAMASVLAEDPMLMQMAMNDELDLSGSEAGQFFITKTIKKIKDKAKSALTSAVEGIVYVYDKTKGIVVDIAQTTVELAKLGYKDPKALAKKLAKNAKNVIPIVGHIGKIAARHVGTFAHFTGVVIDKINPNLLSGLIKASAWVIETGVLIVGPALGVPIPASLLVGWTDVVKKLSNPTNIKAALVAAKTLTGITEAILYEPSDEDISTKARIGDVLKAVVGGVKGLAEFRKENDKKLSKSEKAEIDDALKNGAGVAATIAADTAK